MLAFLMYLTDPGFHHPCIHNGEVQSSQILHTPFLPNIDSLQIPEFVSFDERLENSLQRDVVKLEHVRMRMTHEPINSDLIDMELIELKFVFDRCKGFQFLHTDTFLDPVLSPPRQPRLWHVAQLSATMSIFAERPDSDVWQLGWSKLFIYFDTYIY